MSNPFRLSFGQAIEEARLGFRVWRDGWNGKGIFVKLQIPDPRSRMTLPYLFLDTNNLQTDNPAAVKGRVPWFPSQTDMLTLDWRSSRGEDSEE